MPDGLRRILNQLASAEARDAHPETVELCHRALALTARENDPQLWADVQFRLAKALSQDPSGEQAENLERAIAHYQQVLEVRSRDAFPEEWAAVQDRLAIAYSDRIRGERGDNLEQVIHHFEQALEVWTRETIPEDWAAIQNSLAIAYSERIRGERAESLEKAIRHYRQALQVYRREAFPEEWAMVQNNLATAYSERIRGQRAENLEQSIAHSRLALKEYSQKAFPESWAMVQNNLATTYSERIRGTRAENLEEAIAHFQLALEVFKRETRPEDWAGVQNNLAVAYADRLRGERAENLERAIHHCRQALEVYAREAFPEDWAAVHSNLAGAYAERIRGERAENLEQAIDHCRQALKVQTRRAFPQDWAVIQSNLGIAYFERIHGNRAENLERAIHHSNLALEVHTRQAFSEDWAVIQNTLAGVYLDRILADRSENLEKAIDHCQQALQVHTRQAFPEDWAKAQSHLGAAYSEQICGERSENLERAVHHFRQALEVLLIEAFPAEHCQTQLHLAEIYFAQARWEEAIDAYGRALEANEMLYLVAQTSEARESELTGLEEVPARLAWALLEQRGGSDERALQQALLVLERNRARWLHEALSLHSEKPEQVPLQLWQRFIEGGKMVRELQAEARLPEDTPGKRGYLRLTELLREARSKAEALAAQIGAIDPEFIPQPRLTEIQEAAQQAPLVYLLTTSAGGLALVAHAGGRASVRLLLAEDELSDWLQGTESAPSRPGWLGAYRGRHDSEAAHRVWLDTLDDTAAALWNSLMEPVANCLRDLVAVEEGAVPPVVLVPTGLLSLLPLHAACRKDPSAPSGRRYFLDEFSVSYAPSARALLHARMMAAISSARALLAVDEPKPVSSADLPHSQREVGAITAAFAEKSILRHEMATREAVLSALPAAEAVHFSCHARNDWTNPLQSGLLMAHDRMLTMRDIMALGQAGGRLATLSACETGIVGTRLPNEVVALPSALMQAGFAGAVASLWSVSDIGTAMLMERFYRLWQEANLEPADALRQAQRWLRDTTNRQKAEYYKSHSPTLGGTGGMTESAAIDFFNAMMSHPTGLEGRAFEHPFWWAAFCLTGV